MSHQGGLTGEGSHDRVLAGLADKLGLGLHLAPPFFDGLGPIERYPAGAVVRIARANKALLSAAATAGYERRHDPEIVNAALREL